MITIENSSSVDVKICGEDNVMGLMMRLCGGFWHLQNRPEEFERFVEEMPIADLTFSFKNVQLNILVDKQFKPNAYDEALKAVKTLSDEEQKFSSGYINIHIKENSMYVNIADKERKKETSKSRCKER